MVKGACVVKARAVAVAAALVLSLASCADGAAPPFGDGKPRSSAAADTDPASDAAVGRLRAKAPSLDQFSDRALQKYSQEICADLRRRTDPYPILERLRRETGLSEHAATALIEHAAYNYCKKGYADLMDNAFG